MRKTLIIGGTGTLGKALLRTLDPKDCIVFSRDELKQKNLHSEFPGIKTILGDIRDKSSIYRAMAGVSKVYHFAALKHVDILEDNVHEAMLTNYQGVINSFEVARESNCKEFNFTSTDKACMPINAYGMTKGLAEKYLLERQKDNLDIKIKIFRWGNILGSRGSIIPIFIDSLLNRNEISITSDLMARFWLKTEEAVSFMLSQPETANGILYPKHMRTASVIQLVQVLMEILDTKVDTFDPSKVSIKTVSVRPGEKYNEDIEEEFGVSKVNTSQNRYTEEALIQLLIPIVDEVLDGKN